MKKLIVCCLCLFGAGISMLSAQEPTTAVQSKERKRSPEELSVGKYIDQKLEQSNAIWQKWGGKSCPEFSFKDMTGKQWTQETIREKVTLINFWYIGCGPCIKEMPWLNTLMDKYPDGNYLSCTFNEDHQIKKIVENTPFLFAHLTDALQLFKDFGVNIMPTTIILDKETKVFAVITGTDDTLKRAVEAKLKESLAKD